MEEADERNPPVKVERPATESVPPTERLVGEKLVAERLVAKKLVEVALVEVEFNAVKFCKVDEADERNPVVNVESPAVESVVPIAREPVKFPTDEIVFPLIKPEVMAPKVEAPATERVPIVPL